MSAESGRLAPALIDAVDGILGVNSFSGCLHLALRAVAVGFEHHENRAVFEGSDPEDRTVAASGKFHPQMFFGKGYAVIMGMRNLIGMTETGGP